MENTNLTYFYTQNNLNYLCERFNLTNCSYINKNNEYKFVAPILYSNEKVETSNLSYLPLPYCEGQISNKQLKKEMSNYFSKINELGKKRISLRQDPLVNYNSQIIKSFLQEGFEPNLFYTTIVDLTLTQEVLYQNLRKSFKSLIHGIENDNTLRLVVADKDNNLSGIDDWIEMYLCLVKRGGGNPSKERFKDIETSVRENLAYLYLLYNDKKELVSGVHITFNNKLAYYAASGTNIKYEKTGFFSHYLLWNAIIDLKNKGFNKLEIGPIFYNNVKNFYNHSDKELAISDFKLGMGGVITPFAIWEKKGI